MSTTATAMASAAAATTAAISPSAPAIVVVTNGQVVSIATLILLVTSCLAMLARLATKWAVSKRFHVDDGLAVAALLSHIASGISVSILDKNGLGDDLQTLSALQKKAFAQSAFAADITFICSISFAKLSIIFLFNFISRQQRRHRLINFACAGFIAVWSAASVLGASFLCEPPNTWDVFGKCANKAAFWYSFGVIHALTDVALIIIPIMLIGPLQLSPMKKVMVLSCFATRVCDIGATIALLAFTDAFMSANFTAALWSWVLTTQFVQCISIITSCIPYLKPLLDSLPSGMFMPDELRRKANTSHGSGGGYIRTPEPAFALRAVDSTKCGSEVRNFSRHSDHISIVPVEEVAMPGRNNSDEVPLHYAANEPSSKSGDIVMTTTTTVLRGG